MGMQLNDEPSRSAEFEEELRDEVLDRPAGGLELSCLCGNP
jgi:hypothetical protein